MKCCGLPRDTDYCPDCGKKLGANPLASLLRHCRNQQEHAQRRLERTTAWLAENHRVNPGRLAHLEGTVAKWRGWADALVQATCQNQSREEKT